MLPLRNGLTDAWNWHRWLGETGVAAGVGVCFTGYRWDDVVCMAAACQLATGGECRGAESCAECEVVSLAAEWPGINTRAREKIPMKGGDVEWLMVGSVRYRWGPGRVLADGSGAVAGPRASNAQLS
jgi:hypothetical protein